MNVLDGIVTLPRLPQPKLKVAVYQCGTTATGTAIPKVCPVHAHCRAAKYFTKRKLSAGRRGT